MLRWLEGFEGCREQGIFVRLYEVATQTGGFSSEVGHRGNGFALGSSTVNLKTRDLLSGAADQNTWVMGIAIRMNSFSGGGTTPPWIAVYNASGEQLRFEFIAANDTKPGGNYFKILVKRGATTLATTVDRWRCTTADRDFIYFEFKVTIDTATGGSFSLKHHSRQLGRNQTATWDAANTGINTANQGVAGADRWEIIKATNDSTVSLVIDNIYILDSSGSVNNDFLGEVEIEVIDVSGDGATVQWDLNGSAASLEDAWNESAIVQSAAEDDKRVSTKDVGEIELAALTNLLLNLRVTLVGLQSNLYGRMEASGTRDVQFFYRKTTGTPAQVGTKVVTYTGTSIVGNFDVRETDPNTSAAWLRADVDGLQVGCELDA